MMQSSKKFFFACVVLSVLTISGNIVFKLVGRTHFAKKTTGLDFEKPFADPKVNNLSEDLTSCQLPVSDVEIKYSGEVILASKNLSGSLSIQEQEDFVRFQLQYLFGYFYLNHQRNKTDLFLSSKTIEIEKMVVTQVKYPQDIRIENQWNEDPTSAYQQAAFNNKFVKQNEPAISIKYNAKIFAKACGSVSDTKIEIILPKDPYLAYWAVPKDKFIPMSYSVYKAILNPCVHPEMAEIKKSRWYWYTWAPAQDQCSQAIKNSKFYDFISGAVSVKNSQSQLASNYFPELSSYKVSLVFGMLYPNHVQETVSFLRQNLSDDDLFSLESKIPNKNGQDLLGETTLRPLAFFLANLPRLMTVEKKVWHWLDDKSLQITVIGKLSNGKEIDLEIYYGITSIDYLETPTFTKFITDSLSTSDFVFYTGHAGAGINFSLSQWSKKSLMPIGEIQKLISTKKFQGFVLVSCYSNTYFGEDILRARNQSDLKTVLVRSASQEYIFTTSLGLINFLRQTNLNDQSFKSFIEPLDFGKKIFINFYGQN